jgi:hypothetical protein
MEHWLDLQGGWTLSLFTNTAKGRYFTINIAKHEVAFSSLAKPDCEQMNMVYMDSLILDFPETVKWIKNHRGEFSDDSYKSALPHSVSIQIPCQFEQMNAFLQLPGVRRAIVAYWTESILRLRDSHCLSLFARFHNYNAVAAILEQLRK